jgi:protein involved in polysaccharide export with SLBB domain
VKLRFLPGLGAMFLVTAFTGMARSYGDAVEATPGHVYLEGQIREAAIALPVDHALTASQAIITDGRLSPLADWKNIRIRRKYPDGSIVSIPVDMDDIINKGHLEHDPVVEEGDIIVVPMKPTNFNSPPAH